MNLGTFGITPIHEGLDDPYLYKLAGKVSQDIFAWLLTAGGLRVICFEPDTPIFDLMVLDCDKRLFEKGIVLLSFKSREHLGRVQIKLEHLEALKKEKAPLESLNIDIYVCLAFYNRRNASINTYYLFPLDALLGETSKTISWSCKQTQRIFERHKKDGEKVFQLPSDYFEPQEALRLLRLRKSTHIS